MRKPTAEYVQAWADAGFGLIRLRPQSKLPSEDDWAAHTYEPKEIERWITKFKGNYGLIVPPSFLICDADSRSGGREGLVQFKDDTALHIDWGEVPTIRTGGRNDKGKFGRHCIFRKPEDVNVIGRDALNLEWRSSRLGTSGKYIVGPGSVHPDSGALYLPMNDIAPADAPALPDYWLRRIAKKSKAGDAPEAGQIAAEHLAELRVRVFHVAHRVAVAFGEVRDGMLHIAVGEAEALTFRWAPRRGSGAASPRRRTPG